MFWEERRTCDPVLCQPVRRDGIRLSLAPSPGLREERKRQMLEWYAQPQFRPFTLMHNEDRADGRPGALMIHGFTGTPDELRATAMIAHEIGFDVEVPGLPGMGADIANFSRVSRENWLAAVDDAWQRFSARYRQRILLGYSLGGALAIHAAVERPADAVMLMSPLIRIADTRAFALPVAQYVMKEVAPFAHLDFSHPGVRDFFRKTLPGLDVENPEVQESIRNEFVMPTRLLNECRLVGREAGRLASDIDRPVTIIQGRPDRIVGHKNARWLVDQVTGPVTYHEVPGDHLIPYVATESWPAVKRIVTAYFIDWYAKLTNR